ncbi:MAG: GNAT family N-acetyltransferase [Chloroflexi bacterium]|nr:GNAT family N-acetyltransferase [Chloroflexota bacterium]
MFHIRPFNYTDQDYTAMVAVQAAIWPDRPDTVATCQHRDAVRDKNYFFQRFVVELETKIVAVGASSETAWLYRPGKYFIVADVHPAYERQGIGSALYDHLCQALNQNALPPTMLVSSTREDKPQALRFLEKRNFAPVMRSPVSRLGVATFDLSKFAGLLDKVAASGLQIYSMAELAKVDANWQRQLYELDWECTQDEPLPDAPTRPPFEEYVNGIFEHPDFLPGASFAVLDNGQYVAMTTCHQNAAEPTMISTGFTGVLRTHRRRGLATAIKLLTIDYAQKNDFKTIETGNEENNPMYGINLALGFQPKPAWLDFQKFIA